MPSGAQHAHPARNEKKKTIHAILFDVSGSMRAPLKLRSNARDANNKSTKLEQKRVRTVFDVIYRLAEDGIAKVKDRDIEVAVLCFGLRDVKCCDLLAFLEDRVKILEGIQSSSKLPYDEAVARLKKYDIDSMEISSLLHEVSAPEGASSNNERLFTVVGYRPLIKLLATAGAPYCGNYVKEHLKPDTAGRFFMAFSTPDRREDLHKIVSEMPDSCKSISDEEILAWAHAGADRMGHFGAVGGTALELITRPLRIGRRYTERALASEADERNAVNQATRSANELLSGKGRNYILPVLKSIPTATPMPLPILVRLVKRLKLALDWSDQEIATADSQSKAESEKEKYAPSGGPKPGSIDWERLLDDIEPYLYGKTPMCKALGSDKMQDLFSGTAYSSKVMVLISDGCSTDGKPLPLAKTLRDSGGTIFTCLLTDSNIAEPRRLRAPDEADDSWPEGARALYNMASVITPESGAVQALRRRGWKLPASGQCKLFIQANNPIIVDEFTTAAQHLGTSADALAEMIGQINIDDYIRESNEDAAVTDQERRPICWAHATASVIHLASKRVMGRNVRKFDEIRSHLLKVFRRQGQKSNPSRRRRSKSTRGQRPKRGRRRRPKRGRRRRSNLVDDEGQNVDNVLTKICPAYRLHHKRCDEAEARAAIHAGRPVVAAFWLDKSRWIRFSVFYRHRPDQILSAEDIATPGTGRPEGHAVVLIRCDDKSLTFLNSWGPNFANNGFFTIDKASTLEAPGGHHMQFFDVFWYESDLTKEEKDDWKEYGKKSVGKIIDGLPQSFHDVPVGCPKCKKMAPARDYDGTWYEARCRDNKCNETFKPTIWALIRSLYESNFYPTD